MEKRIWFKIIFIYLWYFIWTTKTELFCSRKPPSTWRKQTSTNQNYVSPKRAIKAHKRTEHWHCKIQVQESRCLDCTGFLPTAHQRKVINHVRVYRLGKDAIVEIKSSKYVRILILHKHRHCKTLQQNFVSANLPLVNSCIWIWKNADLKNCSTTTCSRFEEKKAFFSSIVLQT